MAEHRVPLLGAALRRNPDPSHSRDPRVRELVSALGAVDPAAIAPPVDAGFRAELRAQLVAVAPRLVAEGEKDAVPARAVRETRHAAHAPRRRLRIGKPVAIVAGVLTVFVLLLGGAVLVSRGSLPGDTLYGLKRASEDTEYGLTGGSVAKGKLKLEFAATRISEVRELLPKASSMAAGSGQVADGGQLNSSTAGLVRDTLDSAQGDIRTAAKLLDTAAVRSRTAAPLTAMSSWTPAQAAALRTIIARLPAGTSTHADAVTTWQLIGQARARAAALQARLTCSCVTSAPSDELGPVPCTSPCTPVRKPSGGPTTGTSAPSGRSTGTPGRSGRTGTAAPRQPHPTATTGSRGRHGGTGNGSTRTTAPKSGSGRTGGVLPSGLPTSLLPSVSIGVGGGRGSGRGNGGGNGGGATSSSSPKVPVSVSTCGVSIGGVVGIGVGC